MAKYDDDRPIPPSDEERRLVRWLDNALIYTWKENSDGSKTLRFSCRNPLYEFFDQMMRMGDPGYALAASLFGRAVTDKNVERTVRSRLLTLLACGLHENGCDTRAEITETSVAHFGRFVNVLIADMPQMHVEWAEDMDADDPKRDLRKQPIAVIRGVLLSPALDQRRCVRFWELAAASPGFPLRIFSDPCPPDDGAIFSSYHRRAFGIVFALVSDVAVEKFATHLRDHADRKKVRRWHEPPAGHGKEAGKWTVESESATRQERLNVFHCIAGGIEGNDRRRKVSELFGIV
ncbi:MAG TPA: hypothetical protein VLC10_00280 [Patescibacteria group bacterium]|nr:hypothetical protein [Patescibacteria group bacterium]